LAHMRYVAKLAKTSNVVTTTARLATATNHDFNTIAWITTPTCAPCSRLKK